MKKLICTTAAVLALISSVVATSVQAAGKIGIVDMPRILKEIPQREKIGQMLQKEFADRIQELQGIEKEVQTLLEKQQRDGAMMTESQKTEMSRQLEELKAQFNLRRKALDEDNRRRQGEERNKLLMQIQDAINQVAKRDGFDFVMEGSAVVYASSGADISELVIEQLRKTN